MPREPLGQELPVLSSPVRSSRGKQSSARAGLSLHIISHTPDSISPDQSPSKDPRDLDAEEAEAPLPSPDPILIHSRAPLTPDGSPLTGPPPYQPPGSEADTVDTDRSSRRVPRTLWAHVVQRASPASGPSESLSAAERAEDSYLVQLPGPAAGAGLGSAHQPEPEPGLERSTGGNTDSGGSLR